MSGFVGILVSDPWLQNQFTQVELRSLKSHVILIELCVCVCVFFFFLNLDMMCGFGGYEWCAVHEHEEGEREAAGGGAGGQDVAFKGGGRESDGGGESFVYPRFES